MCERACLETRAISSVNGLFFPGGVPTVENELLVSDLHVELVAGQRLGP